LVQPEVMAAPIRWLISTASDGATGRRFIAKAWDSALPLAEAAKKAGASAGWEINAPKAVLNGWADRRQTLLR
jgi:hypothetical protein